MNLIIILLPLEISDMLTEQNLPDIIILQFSF